MEKKRYIGKKNRGLFVVVLGPDGSGKSTLIQNLQRELRGTFNDVVHFHFMPGLLRRGGGGQPVTNPHAKPPRSWFLSILKLIYYGLDFNLGYLFKVRPALKKSALVLFDRYFDDLLIDPKRYRYGGPLWLARLIRQFIPRPDMMVILDLPPEVAYERKPEVPVETARITRERYLALYEKLENVRIIDASLPLTNIISAFENLIIEYLA